MQELNAVRKTESSETQPAPNLNYCTISDDADVGFKEKSSDDAGRRKLCHCDATMNYSSEVFRIISSAVKHHLYMSAMTLCVKADCDLLFHSVTTQHVQTVVDQARGLQRHTDLHS